MAKIFQIGDVLPATTRLLIHLKLGYDDYFIHCEPYYNGFKILFDWRGSDNDYADLFIGFGEVVIVDEQVESEHEDYYIIDISNLTLEQRTITGAGLFLDFNDNYFVTWEDLNASSGYTITFEENGGSSVSDITEATELPPSLPTPTRDGYKFVAWYYESDFQTRAKAGDTIESNVTLYAKWHNFGSLFTEIADAIRSKDGTSESIRDLDFGERVKQIQGAKEEETKTVTPNFSSGNFVVTPTSGKVLSQVTINKDANLIEDNIKSGVTIFGEAGGLVEGKPIEVSTAIAMDNLLVSDNVGKVYKFTGTTDANYINGELYEVVSE